MKIKVTHEGINIPKHWFEGVQDVMIQKDQDVITITPVHENDPVFEIGKYPIHADVEDASTNHDAYLYE